MEYVQNVGEHTIIYEYRNEGCLNAEFLSIFSVTIGLDPSKNEIYRRANYTTHAASGLDYS